MAEVNGAPQSEQAGLPAWLYPLGFWVGLGLLALAALWPAAAGLAVGWVMAVPALAAVWVAVSSWRRDRRLGVAALTALAGLVVVFVARRWL